MTVEKSYTVTCKNCDQEIIYFNMNSLKSQAINCPKCSCTLDTNGNILVKPILPSNVQEEIKNLTNEHEQLHLSCEVDDFDNYYDFLNLYERHLNVIKALEQRNVFHKYKEDFLDDYYKFDKQEFDIKDEVNIDELLQYLKSFKIKDPFIYLTKDNEFIINTTKEETEKTAFLKIAIWKTLKLLPRRYWGAFKFLKENNTLDECLDSKTVFSLNCSRIVEDNRYVESAYNNNTDFLKSAVCIKGELLKQARYIKDTDKLLVSTFFLNLVDKSLPYTESNFIVSNFVEQDYPLYITKNSFGLNCQIHKDGDIISIYTEEGIKLNEYLPNIIKVIKTLSVDSLIVLGTLELVGTQTDTNGVLEYLKTDNKDNNIVCNINDVLYFDTDLHKLNFSERRKFLDILNIKQSTFTLTKSDYQLNKLPYIFCKKRDELEKALQRLNLIDNNGVVIRVDMPYTLSYKQPGLFIYNKEIKKCVSICKNENNINEISILCNFLNCEIKDIYINVMHIPHVESGNIFNSVEVLLKNFTLIETRNFSSYEIPPLYQEIKLKKNLSKTFLVEGTSFYYDDTKNMPIIIQRYPVWGGYQAKIITHINEKEYNNKLLRAILLYAQENNFLRNEKFSVTGEFLDEQTITWEDLKLSNSIKDKLRKVESLISKNDPNLDSRGLIFIGPPGCGKTLTGKLLSKMAPTFIWVTAKDCSAIGPSSAFSIAFSLARNLRPSILFMEDIDSYIEYGMIDLLKTELDGLKLNNGIFTILTSNFPEKLPEALIDRPGRFHDIIYFNLPNKEIRKEMLLHFLKEDISDAILESVLKQTEGFSGAHIKEICRFAQIIQKEDTLDMPQALLKSLEKLLEQRKLIRDIKGRS